MTPLPFRFREAVEEKEQLDIVLSNIEKQRQKIYLRLQRVKK